MVRCFIGIFLPNEIKSKIISLQNKLKLLPMKAKFVEPENLHICLSFLGEVEEQKIEILSKILDSIARKYKKFEVNVSGIKIIPNEKYIRVLALHIKDENKNLEKMSKDIKEKTGGNVKPAHLTLCRVKNILNKNELLEKIKKLDSEIGRLVVSSVFLIKSTLQKTGPIYSVLHESNLS
jgi:2'-5' RNA ligase